MNIDNYGEDFSQLIQLHQLNKKGKMKEQFLPYEESLALKEIDFDEETFCVYGTPFYPYFGGSEGITSLFTIKEKTDKIREGLNYKWVKAPIYQQAFKWFRDKHSLINSIEMSSLNSISFDIRILSKNHFKTIKFSFCSLDGIKTYEEAELACIRELIKIVKDGK